VKQFKEMQKMMKRMGGVMGGKKGKKGKKGGRPPRMGGLPACRHAGGTGWWVPRSGRADPAGPG
jgi:hypothetical protein